MTEEINHRQFSARIRMFSRRVHDDEVLNDEERDLLINLKRTLHRDIGQVSLRRGNKGIAFFVLSELKKKIGADERAYFFSWLMDSGKILRSAKELPDDMLMKIMIASGASKPEDGGKWRVNTFWLKIEDVILKVFCGQIDLFEDRAPRDEQTVMQGLGYIERD